VVRTYLVISAIGHLAVIGWASFSFPSAKPFEVEPIKALPVEFISATDLTRLKAGERKPAKPVPEAVVKKAEADKPGEDDSKKASKQVASLPPPPPPKPEPAKTAAPAPAPPRPQKSASEDAAEPKPEPVPAKEAKKDEASKAEKDQPVKDVPVPTIRPRHSPAPAAKAEEKKEEKFDPSRIAALLDKAPNQAAPAARSEETAAHSSAGDPRGLDDRMSISELDALRMQVSRCWSPPVGVRGASDLAVRLRLALNADGTLSRPPEVLTTGSGLAFLAAADSARRAVLRCQPYELPSDKYEAWRDINMNFDPRQMLGG